MSRIEPLQFAIAIFARILTNLSIWGDSCNSLCGIIALNESFFDGGYSEMVSYTKPFW